MKETFHFQVNLGGMLDVLSNHLYKSPDVFLRELLQNGVDAVTQRRKRQPGWNVVQLAASSGPEQGDLENTEKWNGGRISISLEEGQRLAFTDNGTGLTEEEIHRFLAVIGQSSKTELVNGQMPEDYIGRFGIGLLSCFMVSDSITVHTRSFSNSHSYMWKGFPDGTYTFGELAEELPVGTTVILEAKPGREEYFTRERVAELVRYYGLALPVPVYFGEEPHRLNDLPEHLTQSSRTQMLSFGEWLFEEEFLEAIPIQTAHLNGVAFVLPFETAATVKGGHRLYLKEMLLTERGDRLLPSWAFFLRCFLNTRGLRPTASREEFYEDQDLKEAQNEFAEAVASYLSKLAAEEPDRLRTMVSVHEQALKSMAVWNDELFTLFINYLTFETSEGRLNGDVLRQKGEASYISTLEKYHQLKPIFMASGELLVCGAYTYDRELLQKFNELQGVAIQPLSEERLDTALKEPSWEQRSAAHALLRAANRGLAEFDCRAEVKSFLPAELPVLYAMSDEVRFLREAKSAQDMSNGIFSSALSSLLSGLAEKPLATLHLNMNNVLIQRLCAKEDQKLLESTIRVLYIQAMLAGGYPLHGHELQVMGQELLYLVDHD